MVNVCLKWNTCAFENLLLLQQRSLTNKADESNEKGNEILEW